MDASSTERCGFDATQRHNRARDMLEYRRSVGIMLLNRHGEVFVGRRIDIPSVPAWQMPQGGIDSAEILRESRTWLLYDLPPELGDTVWGGRYRGQKQRWFAMRFTGSDSDINLATAHPEFDCWQWVPPQRLPEMIVPFKRQLYLDVLAEFREHCIANPHNDKP